MAALAWGRGARADPALERIPVAPPSPMALQLAGKGLDTAKLVKMLAASYRRQQQQLQRGRRRRQRGEEVEGEAGGQPIVTALDASSNALEALPLGSPEASLVVHGLVELRLAHNSLQGGLVAFKSLRRLVHLDLSHNQLTSTSGLDGSLVQLQTLNLAHNQLTEVGGLVLPALVELDLSGNRIPTTQRLRGLSLNTRLRVLRLEGNPLATGRSRRAAILHLLPTLRLLDNNPCYPHRSSLVAARTAAGGMDSSDRVAFTTGSGSIDLSSSSSSSSYSSIHRPPQSAPKCPAASRRPRYAKDTQVEMIRRGLDPQATIVSTAFGGAVPPPPPPYKAPAAGARARAGAERPERLRSPPPQLIRPPPTDSYVPPWRRLPNPLPRGWRDFAGLAAEGLVGLDLQKGGGGKEMTG